MNDSPRRGFGWLKDRPDFRDYRFAPLSDVLADGLPPRIDLRNAISESSKRATPRVFDQGNLGSCTANAANAVAQYVERYQDDPDADRLSRLWTYWYSREKIDSVDSDSGASIRDAFAVLAERGAPRETYWPYEIGKFRDEPTHGQRSAPHHRTLEYRSILDNSEQDMRACLAEGYPFAFGFAVYESWEEISSDGIWAGTRGPILGYHATAAWGYDFDRGAFAFPNGGWIVRNSWGSEWGDHGYFYVPREWMPNEAFDCWTIRRVSIDP